MNPSVEALRKSFNSGVLRSFEARKGYLKKLWEMMEKHEADIYQALDEDLKKPKYESFLTEISQVKSEISLLHANLEHWCADEKVPKTFLFMMDSSYIQRQPYGVTLNLSAWNYPIQLSLMVVAGAIAAGNVVLLKPSELAPASEQLFKRLIPKYLDEVCKVFCGGPDETTQLMQNNRFDIILYTGSSRVGKIVMAEAAKTLTPVILELGGKSPTYVDQSVNLDLAATRISWAKFLNCGQTCVAPDYILCHEAVYDEFISLVMKKAVEFYGEDADKSPDYGRIINERHVRRLEALMRKTSGKVVFGGKVEVAQKYVAPTIVKDVTPKDVLMEDELFGPIMPILKVKNCDEAIGLINNGEKPLALYVFTTATEICNQFLEQTSSGGFIHNDCVMHGANPGLPFGGVGHSGMGAYHGKHSIDSFSHKRAVVLKSSVRSTDFVRLPPFQESSGSWGKWLLKSKMKGDGGYCCIM